MISVYFSGIYGYYSISIKFSLVFKNRKGDFMNLAKISSNGQITVPVEIRRQLGLKAGDKILFFQKPDGEIVISNASAQTIRKAQAAFSGVAEEMSVYNEEDVQSLVDDVRYRKGK